MAYNSRREITAMELETVLMKAYSAEQLKIFCGQYLQGLADNPAIIAAHKNTPLVNLPTGKMLKKDRVELLAQIFGQEDLFGAFYSQQSELCNAVLAQLVWYGGTSLEGLEQQTGKRLAVRNKGNREYYEPFVLNSGLELLQMDVTRSRYGMQTKKENIFVYLPEAIRQILRTTFPKPAAYNLNPLKEVGEAEFTHCSESSALIEIPRMIEFIRQGHLIFKKSGGVTVKGLNDLTKLSGIKEFYSSDFDKALGRIKVGLLASFLLMLDFKKVAVSSSPPVMLRNAFIFWANKKDQLAPLLLNHLRMETYGYYLSSSENIKKALCQLLKRMEPEKWVSLDNIFQFCLLREINLMEMSNAAYKYQAVEKTQYGSWKSWVSLNEITVVPVLYFPLLKGFFFLAASLGLVEIGYDKPENKILQKPGYDYLSPYDGLKYVRLTRLGAYVTGKSRQYTVVGATQDKAVFILDKTRLLLTMDGEDPMAILTLEKMLVPIGTGRFMMTFESLFRDCQSKKDVQRKIAMFRRTICKKLPAVWQDFFTKALARVNPLTLDSGFKVFRIGEDEELLRLLATAPDISRFILKVEGYRIAVKKENIGMLTRRLKKYGYLISGKALHS